MVGPCFVFASLSLFFFSPFLFFFCFFSSFGSIGAVPEDQDVFCELDNNEPTNDTATATPVRRPRQTLITETVAALGAKQSTPIVGRDRHRLRRLSSWPSRESSLGGERGPGHYVKQWFGAWRCHRTVVLLRDPRAANL